MKYAVLVYETSDDFAARTDAARQGEYWASYSAYGQFLGDKIDSGAALQGTDTATTLRLRDGERHVQDGPFADTKEMLGGFYVVEAKDLDHALELASKCPSAKSGSVEVRPLLQMEM